ncbi:hypothetical protein [Bradyrhizobium acaciae]|uniref:hypothetical protein n=1 Tax=Bradyrhizobium acaciae TaxID=2683706 RepID=UPI001E34F16B|nr:hypothetical protein [Bradyrhizobium acaciae]
MAELNEARFVIGAGKLWSIVLKTDVACGSRHVGRSIVSRRALTSGAYVAPDSMSTSMK